MKNNIDIVITWVDNNDKKWKEEKKKFEIETLGDSRNIRYRDWGLLKYWFRGIEYNAHWVNKIHFVTYGHYPDWLNINHPKLNLVKHEDFIPKEFLPTFNSRVIELYFHKIPNITEKFIYFNDDMFIIDKTDRSDFFENNLPKDSFILDTIPPTNDTFHSTLFNNLKIVNHYFDKKEYIKNNFKRVFNLKYKSLLFKNILLYPWSNFTGFHTIHLPVSYLKSTFNTVWVKEEKLMRHTSSCKFRTNNNINHFLFRYYQLVNNLFIPSRVLGSYFDLSSNNNNIYKHIRKKKTKLVCINDSSSNFDFESEKMKLINSFEFIYPLKSNFEN